MVNDRLHIQQMIRKLVFHMISICISLLFVLPLFWMISASLRQPGLPPPRTMEWIPTPIAWSNYARIFEMIPLAQYVLNSLIVATTATLLTLTTASLGGFAMAQSTRRTQNRLITLSLILLIIPGTATWLGRFFLIREMGLFNSLTALLIPSLMGSSPLFVLLFYWNFRRIPSELYDAARMDGATSVSIWWRIALPLSSGTIVAVSILAFLLYWGDFISPLFYLKDQNLYTLPIGLRQLQELDRTNWSLLMAGSMVMTLPAVLLFSVLQKYFLQENRLTGFQGQ